MRTCVRRRSRLTHLLTEADASQRVTFHVRFLLQVYLHKVAPWTVWVSVQNVGFLKSARARTHTHTRTGTVESYLALTG